MSQYDNYDGMKALDDNYDGMKALENTMEKGKRISKYRIEFILQKYDSMPVARRRLIAKKAGKKQGKEYVVELNGKDDLYAVLSNEERDFEETICIAQTISEELDSKGKPKEKELRRFKRDEHSVYLSYVQTASILFILAAGAFLALIPLISALILGQDVFGRIWNFFEPYHWLGILCVGVFNVCAYLINLKLSNMDIKGSFKKSLKITFAYAFLPVFFYTVAYAAIYFLS